MFYQRRNQFQEVFMDFLEGSKWLGEFTVCIDNKTVVVQCSLFSAVAFSSCCLGDACWSQEKRLLPFCAGTAVERIEGR